MKAVLVTGARGFIGSQLCKRLIGSGVELHAVSRQPPTDVSAWWLSIGGDLNDVSRAALIRWWRVDLVNLEETRKLVRNLMPQETYHLASLVTGSRSREAVLPTLQNNFITALNLLLATSEGAANRIVLAGSVDEPDSAEPVPCSPYAAAKRAASDYARMFAALYKLNVVSTRIAMVYGPGQTDHAKLIPYAVTSFLRGECPKLGSGRRLIDWIYVDDAVDGLIASARASGVAGGTVDIASGETCSIRAIVEQIRDLIPGAPEPKFDAIADRPFERQWKVDVAASNASTGWKASTPLRAGLQRTVDWYKRHLIERQFGRDTHYAKD